jgi:hypothetical protein
MGFTDPMGLTAWIQGTPFSMFIRGSDYAYPIILALHVTGISLFGGMVLMTDLRLLGWTNGGLSIADLVDRLRTPRRIGLIFVAACGVLLLIGNPEKYLANIFFRIKLLLFALLVLNALIFRRSGRVKLAAGLSLLLWFGVVCAGRGIGYIVYRPATLLLYRAVAMRAYR